MVMVTVAVEQSCGCTISHSIRSEEDFEDIAEFLRLASVRLAYWYGDRVGRHDCNLVSIENINGLTPKDGK